MIFRVSSQAAHVNGTGGASATTSGGIDAKECEIYLDRY